ncbi:enoyl-CoA hydratase/isomerase family protein [Dactylosporangium aurantiacum]|uniref:Enoyl-CoA hydratase/isomerase family protein n=1 Tax=Dactylosporangium aurantiacum TaxID=35754 RepID=A0A9Q9IDA6_9ACTN|nr:enoyl-CoA hydratase/isomerase family protein [Dactylosporangium aurantiacum]MDG6109601.1 enoyl-CoA hydratase/isomerase family protein [Dactylosporangium aurantiacum]UWZ54224.1 enoyl-CoA hydratase/isomerase family protein [Dactylosporangium aurantiacum]
MSDGEIRVDVDGAVATLLIDNPGKRNALTAAMWTAVPEHLSALAADPAVKVLVVAGAGGTFSAGADLDDAATIAAAGEDSVAVHAERALAAFPKPVIARIDGFCVGGGCQLAVACDLRFAASDSRFGVTPAKLGIVYPPSTTRRLAALVGPARAKLLLFTGDLIDAATAERIGLVDTVAPAADLAALVQATATTIAARSQHSVRSAKAIIDGSDGAAPHDPAEVAEGIAAFRERRAPRWMD